MTLNEIRATVAKLLPAAVSNAVESPGEINAELNRIKLICRLHYEELGFDCMFSCFGAVMPTTEDELTLSAVSSKQLSILPWTFRVRCRPFYISAAHAHFEINHKGPLPTVTETGYRSIFAPMATFSKISPEQFIRTEICKNLPSAYHKLLIKPSFAKSDFSALESFYGAPYERLTDFGKGQLSKRTRRGTMEPDKRDADIENDKLGTIVLTLLQDHQKKSLAALKDPAAPKANADTFRRILIDRLRLNEEAIDLSGLSESEQDALHYSHTIKAGLRSRFDQVSKQVSREQAVEIRKSVEYMFDTLLLAAQSEYELGLQENFIKSKN